MENTYPNTAGHRGVDTSVQAAESVDAKGLRDKAFTMLRQHPDGLTSCEIAVKLSIPFFSIQPRISELKAKGLVYDSKQRREGRSGQAAIVWCVTPADQVKPPKVKLKPLGDPVLYGKMLQATIAYGKEPTRYNQMEMHEAGRRWQDNLAGRIGDIEYEVVA